MGYGAKVSPWNGRRVLTWRLTEGVLPSNLTRALDIWAAALGLTFERVLVDNASVDFRVKSDPSYPQWSPRMKLMLLKPESPLGIVLYEIGHLLGLSHEHDRPDRRDTYYGEARDPCGLEGATLRGANLQKYGERPDEDSIMMYPETHYAGATAPSAGDISAVRGVNGW